MHDVTCVKCMLENLAFHSSLSFKAGNCHVTGCVVTGDRTGIVTALGFQYSCTCSSDYFMFKPSSCKLLSCNVIKMSRCIYSPKYSEQTPHGLPVRMGYGMSFVSSYRLSRALALFPLCFVWYRVIVDQDRARVFTSVKRIFGTLVI